MNAGAEKTRLDTCGCCRAEVPGPAIDNPPGLPSLSYRIGTHSELLRRLVARLPKWTIPDGDHAQQRPLAKLTTRSGDDPALALLDAWAVVGDVLTFYQERIANEGFLRTASERRSVLELARAIGYELDPGVAASTYLAFTVEDAEQLPDTAAIPAGTRVQSIPMSNDELPQTFETSHDFEARVAWNKLKPRATAPLKIRRGVTELYLDGIRTKLQPGDPILLVGQGGKDYPGGERWDFRVLKTVDTFPDDNGTRVTWETGLGHDRPTVEPADNPEVHTFRLRAALFGHNAPDWRAMPKSIKDAWDPHGQQRTQWPDFEIQTTAERIIDLDAVYPKIVVDSWIVLSKPAYVELYKAEEAGVDSRTDYTLTAKVTRLKLDSGEHLSWFPLRDTVVYAESEKLELAGKPIETAIQGKTIQLAGLVNGLQRDHVIIVSGKEHVDDGLEVSEVAVVASATPGDGYTELELQEELTHEYDRATVTIYANVVHATHGETVAGEVLGSGDGARSFQVFQLKKPPLTYVSAASGSESTLSLRVEGVQWRQVPSLFAVGQTSRSYTVRINDGAEARVIFGDGRDGARLPTGQENVVAAYRSGIGVAGNVGAGSLMLLKTRPFGIRGVSNPSAASGGEDPERLADARKRARHRADARTYRFVAGLRGLCPFLSRHWQGSRGHGVDRRIRSRSRHDRYGGRKIRGADAFRQPV